MKHSYTPIALFVYNRLDNTRQTIEHLLCNKEAEQSELYVFSDGGKDDKTWEEVKKLRAYLHSVKGFKEVHIVERFENYYLERNVIEGISEVFEKHDSIIVMEDDVCTSPFCLEYLNGALCKYKEEKRVMHIASFTNLDIPTFGDTYFTPHMSGCGCWATWKDRWQKFRHFKSRDEALEGMSSNDIYNIEYGGNFTCLKSLDRNPIPWDICWEVIIRKSNGLCLHPTHTLIRNIGLSSGTHFNAFNRIFGWYDFDRPYRTTPVLLADIPIEENPIIEAMYANALKDHGMRYNWFGKLVRYLYKKLRK